MNIDEWYEKLCGWGCGKEPPKTEPEPWQPDIDKSLPKDVYDAMVRTAHIDKEREIEAARWSSEMLAQYQNTALGPQMMATYEGKSITPTWRNTEMNQGEITNHGVVRINFPFGQVEMDIRNEAELDRMVDMAKHMLQVHEENTATAAIRENLRMTSKQSEPGVVEQKKPRSPEFAFGAGAGGGGVLFGAANTFTGTV